MTTTETATRKGIIYKYTSPSNKSYIGQTVSEVKRKAQHKADSLKGVSKFYSAIRKYGYDSFKYEVIYTIEGTKEAIKTTLDKKEYEYITKYNSAFKGYNSTNGNQKYIDLDYHGQTKQELINTAFNFCNGDYNNSNVSNYWKRIIRDNYYASLQEGWVCYYIYDEITDTVKIKSSIKNCINTEPYQFLTNSQVA